MDVKDPDLMSDLKQILRETKSNTTPIPGLEYLPDEEYSGVDCNEVYPNVFIGNWVAAKNKDYLKKLEITHVLNTAEGKAFSLVDTNEKYYKDVNIKYLGFSVHDLPGENISEYFKVASDFIEKGSSKNNKVFVHCLMGKSRSVTCVIAYLMLKRGLSVVDALKLVKEKREIFPNWGFLNQLINLQKSLERREQNIHLSCCKSALNCLCFPQDS